MRRIEEEKKVIELMVNIYCRKKEGNSQLCPNCQELLRYAYARLDKCRFGEKKPPCKKCTVHCYRPLMRHLTQQVMRFAGPRMILYSPLEAIRHLIHCL